MSGLIEVGPRALAAVPLLASFSADDIAKLVVVGRQLVVEPHTNIIIEGELTWGMYLVLEGQVGVYKINHLTGQSHEVGLLQSGAFFGEMSLIDDLPRSATVQSLTQCTLFFVDKDSFRRTLLATSEARLRFAEDCTRLLISRLRALNDDYVVSQYQLWRKALGGLRRTA